METSTDNDSIYIDLESRQRNGSMDSYRTLSGALKRNYSNADSSPQNSRRNNKNSGGGMLLSSSSSLRDRRAGNNFKSHISIEEASE